MDANRKQSASKKRIKLTLVILAFSVLWVGYTVYKQFVEISVIKGKITELKGEEQQVLDTNKTLQKKALLLEDKDYIAEMARKYYFLSKPGEIIFISPEE